MANIIKQVRMVFDLNKCLGCQACTMACKTIWTDRNQGQMYQYWNNVETRPGRGYPKNWETLGGGFSGGKVDLGGDVHVGDFPKIQEDYGAPWQYNYGEVLKTDGGDATSSLLKPSPEPNGPDAYANNWDEDVGQGDNPGNNYYFYLPRICNHCTNPACVAACPRQAVYKREEDGIVLVDQNRCRGYRYCVKGCPYKKVYFNPQEKLSQKCIFCYPRLEKDPVEQNFCFTQCVGRIRYVGYNTNPQANVNKLIDDWKVAMLLFPEFGTEPNLYYIPPMSPPANNGGERIPIGKLADLFGDNKDQKRKARIARIEEIFNTLETERAKVAAGGTSELIDILVAKSEADRLQLDLG
jgi:DMSO reductase family type II enzyme iron-sulfur subunit